MTLLLFLLLICTQVFAFEHSSQGNITLENRVFDDDHNAQTYDENFALAVELEGEVSFDTAGFFKYSGFARSDFKDESRSRYFLKDFHYAYEQNSHQFVVGNIVLNWSNLEAFHPADIFNARNFDSDFESAEKIGETVFGYQYFLSNGKLSFFLVPRLQRIRYAGERNRLGFGTIAQYESEQLFIDENGEHKRVNFAQGVLRGEWFLEGFDFSVFAMRSYDRGSPSFALITSGAPLFIPRSVHPVYFMATQFGGNASASPWEGHIFKFEFLHKSYEVESRDVKPYNGNILADANAQRIGRPDHTTVAIGHEYTMNHDGGSSSNIFTEYQMIVDLDKAERTGLSFFQNDLFLGYRFNFNDIKAREITASIIIDQDYSEEYLATLRYAQRLNDQWSVKTGIRHIKANLNGQAGLGLALYDKADHIFLNLSRFF